MKKISTIIASVILVIFMSLGVRISGNGNIKVNASEQLDVSISGIGNVYYIVNPNLNQKNQRNEQCGQIIILSEI